jgi:beta-glucuronidase
VVDLYGARKPSFEVLRRESSPVRDLQLKIEDGSLTATVVTRADLPAYTLTGYRLRWIAYTTADLPMEQAEAPLPPLAPGKEVTLKLRVQEKNAKRVRVDVVRPTGFSAATADWRC